MPVAIDPTSADSKLPRLADGFIDRGANVTRLEAFVDAAFAFAVTLLVISLNSIPSSIAAMVDALKGVPAFAASFAQIMVFWSAHATWSRRFGLDDARSQRLSLLLVFLILVYVYPLKIVFGSLFYWISRGWLPAVANIQSLWDLKTMFVVYGIAFATLSLCLAALYRQALRGQVVPALEPAEIKLCHSEIVRWFYTALVAAASMGVALLLPAAPPVWMTGMPGMTYSLLSLTGWVVARFGGGKEGRPAS
jgi:uncharacterized membrane protein